MIDALSLVEEKIGIQIRNTNMLLYCARLYPISISYCTLKVTTIYVEFCHIADFCIIARYLATIKLVIITNTLQSLIFHRFLFCPGK